MEKLQGSPKQIAWAEQIRTEMLDRLKDPADFNHLIKVMQTGKPKANAVIEEIKGKLTDNVDANNQVIMDTIKNIIKAEKSAKMFIEHKYQSAF